MNRVKRPLVSYILTAYNQGEFVAQAIQSVLDQDYPYLELILIDNGSTDDTAQVIKQFTDKRIRKINIKENQGVSPALNLGIKKAKGEYLCFFTSDDILLPQKTKIQVNYLQRHHQIGAVFSLPQAIDENGKIIDNNTHPSKWLDQKNRPAFEWLNFFFHVGNPICYPSSMIRKQVIKKTGFHHPLLSQLHDMDYWVRLCLHSEIHIIQERLFKFRFYQDNRNVSGMNPEKYTRTLWEYQKVILNYLNVTRSQFDLIFPDNQYKDYPSVKEAFALICLNTPSQRYFHQRVGLELLWEIYQSSEKAKTSFKEFFTYTGKYDLFLVSEYNLHQETINNLKSTIQLDQGPNKWLQYLNKIKNYFLS